MRATNRGTQAQLPRGPGRLPSPAPLVLMAAGAEGAGIVVIVHGHRIELDLSRLRNPPEQQSALAHRPRDMTLPQSEYAGWSSRC